MICHLILFLSIFAMIGCSTISGTHQIVSVDSDPRGVPIFLEQSGNDKKFLGYTPFFSEMPRNNNLTLWTPDSSASMTQIMHVNCDYRWITSYLGNAPFYGIKPFVYLAAIGIDYLSKASYECPDRFSLQLDLPTPANLKAKNECYSAFIIGPYWAGEKTMNKLLDEWFLRLKDRDYCISIFKLDESPEILEYLNISHKKELNLKELSHHIKNYIGLKTGSHLLGYIETSKDEETGHVNVSTRLFDLHKEEYLPNSGTNFTLTDPDLALDSPSEILSDLTFQLIPNSVRYGADQSEVPVTGKNGFKIDQSELEFNLPRLISFLDLTTVSLPYGFEPWDVNLSTEGSMSFFYWSYRLKLRKGDNPKESHEYSLLASTAIWSLKLTLHTPLGAVSGFVGAGILVSSLKEQGAERSTRLSRALRPGFDYIAFITNQIYFYFEIYQLRAALPEGEKIRPSDSVQHIGLGFGYYFGKSTFQW